VSVAAPAPAWSRMISRNGAFSWSSSPREQSLGKSLGWQSTEFELMRHVGHEVPPNRSDAQLLMS